MTRRDATGSRGTGPDRTGHDRDGRPPPPGAERTERELRDALLALAGGVSPDPDAYRTARGTWPRRERRRRLVLTVLVAVVFALATLIGLWVLDHAPSDAGTVFSGDGAAAADGPSLPRSGP